MCTSIVFVQCNAFFAKGKYFGIICPPGVIIMQGKQCVLNAEIHSPHRRGKMIVFRTNKKIMIRRENYDYPCWALNYEEKTILLISYNFLAI